VNKLLALVVAVAMLVASGMQMYTAVKIQAVLQMDPELERLAIAYYRDQQERREIGRRIDEANRKAERDVFIPMPKTQPALRFDGNK
jgi:hypothetical protein